MLLGGNALARAEQDRSPARCVMVNHTISCFQSCFPTIKIRLLDNVETVNAQASRSRDQHLIDVFGGFAFNPDTGTEALKFLLLHELGHHLSPGPRMSQGSQLACDCAADVWAVTQGVAQLAAHNLAMDLDEAMAQMDKALPSSLNSMETDCSRDERCWCCCWSRRKHLLCNRGMAGQPSRCFMFEPRMSTY